MGLICKDTLVLHCWGVNLNVKVNNQVLAHRQMKWMNYRANGKSSKYLLTNLLLVNNFVALWRLGARDILELPLLAARSMMETAPMAGKT